MNRPDIETGKEQPPVYIQTQKEPCCIRFWLDDPTPKLLITVQDAQSGRYYYFRYKHKPVDEIQIRMPKTPDVLLVTFFTDNPFGIKNLQKGVLNQVKVDWSDPRLKNTIGRSYSMDDIRCSFAKLDYEKPGDGTPARHFVQGELAGLIEYDPKAKQQLPVHTWEAIKRHELAHFFYDDEDMADLWGLYKYIEDGYNISQYENALLYVLSHTPENVDRIVKMYKETRDFDTRYFD